jgi:hypothetical protein
MIIERDDHGNMLPLTSVYHIERDGKNHRFLDPKTHYLVFGYGHGYRAVFIPVNGARATANTRKIAVKRLQHSLVNDIEGLLQIDGIFSEYAALTE